MGEAEKIKSRANEQSNDRIVIDIPLEPKGQMRVKARAVVKGKNVFAKAYKDKRQRLREERVLLFIKDHIPKGGPWTDPAVLTLYCFIPVPKSYSKARRERCLFGMELPAKTPDLSNVMKMIEDCLNRLIFADDKQIVSSVLIKVYREKPGMRVVLDRVKDRNLYSVLYGVFGEVLKEVA